MGESTWLDGEEDDGGRAKRELSVIDEREGASSVVIRDDEDEVSQVEGRGVDGGELHREVSNGHDGTVTPVANGASPKSTFSRSTVEERGGQRVAVATA